MSNFWEGFSKSVGPAMEQSSRYWQWKQEQKKGEAEKERIAEEKRKAEKEQDRTLREQWVKRINETDLKPHRKARTKAVMFDLPQDQWDNYLQEQMAKSKASDAGVKNIYKTIMEYSNKDSNAAAERQNRVEQFRRAQGVPESPAEQSYATGAPQYLLGTTPGMPQKPEKPEKPPDVTTDLRKQAVLQAQEQITSMEGQQEITQTALRELGFTEADLTPPNVLVEGWDPERDAAVKENIKQFNERKKAVEERMGIHAELDALQTIPRGTTQDALDEESSALDELIKDLQNQLNELKAMI